MVKLSPKLSRRWYRGDEVEALQDPRWLIDGVLPDKSFTMLYGESGSGKSFLALDWALSVAHGRPWMGRSVEDGDVVYIAAEDAADLKYRRRAWLLSHLPKRLTAKDSEPPVERVAYMPEAWDIVAGYPTLVKDIRALGWHPRLVVLDTLARCFDGDENSAQEVGALIKGCDAVRHAFPKTTVLVVHHTGKDPDRGARGSSALKAALDTEMLLVPGANQNKRLVCTKMKPAEPFATVPWVLRQVAVGDGRRSCTVGRGGAGQGRVDI